MTALMTGTHVAWADKQVETNGRSYLVRSKDIRHEKVSDARVTVLGLTIGLHSLTDVQKALGQAMLLQRSEQQPHQICYV